MNKEIYTIGHSNHELSFFIELLKHFTINCIVDVRSVAASAYNPQFNKISLASELQKSSIAYLHFAQEFGARHEAPSLLDSEGKVDFEKVQASASFRKGVRRLQKGIDKGFNIALMCSEGDPFDCHRFAMVSQALANENFTVKHILKDKNLLTQKELEEQLLKKYAKRIPQPSIFQPQVSREVQLKAAYKLRNKDIGYSPENGQEGEGHND
ncbi:MAG: DUF488 domain-containing protein [Bernardetiaceae bacterium]|nr:DUF488 domain-containing protein [Bernardetiaceae bacterium]